MRQGVILPQDAEKVDQQAVERTLSSFPPSCVLQLHLHRTDELVASVSLIHPFVRAHIVDLRSGAYFPKSDPGRHVVAPYENMAVSGEGQKTILPIMSKPYPLQATGTFTCQWDERLLFNERLSHLLTPWCLLLFEVLEFGPHVDLERYPEGLQPVAWAFLKVLDARGRPNLGRQLRLQLYRYHFLEEEVTSDGLERSTFNQLMTSVLPCLVHRPAGLNPTTLTPSSTSVSSMSLFRAGVPRVYYEWIWCRVVGRSFYPSTLFLDALGSAPPAREVVRGMRPVLPTQIEEGRMTLQQIMEQVRPATEGAGAGTGTGGGGGAGSTTTPSKQATARQALSEAQRLALQRRRTAGEACHLPNRPLYEISAGAQGVFVLAFSPDGTKLAAAVGEGIMFTVKIYASDSGEQLFTFLGHHDLIYDLAWNILGHTIVTASSDTTVKVWQAIPAATNRTAGSSAVETAAAAHARAHPIATLQHNGFVYAASFHSRAAESEIVVTGGIDGILRVWNWKKEEVLMEYGQASPFLDGTAAFNLPSPSSLSAAATSVAYITSLTWSPNGTRLFVADAHGKIRIFEDTKFTRGVQPSSSSSSSSSGATQDATTNRGDLSARTASSSWSTRLRLLHTLSPPEMRGVVISCIRYHPRPERLVAYCRDNCIYSFSMIRYEIRHILTGVPSHSHSLRCTISPDGRLVAAGGEDGRAYFFDLSNGQLVHVLPLFPSAGGSSPVNDIGWNMYQHQLAFASFGHDYPIHVWEWNAKFAQSTLAEATQQETRQERAASATGRMERTGMMSGGSAMDGNNPFSSSRLPPHHPSSARSPTGTGTAAAPLSSSMKSRPNLAITAAATANYDDDIGEGDDDGALTASKRVTFTR